MGIMDDSLGVMMASSWLNAGLVTIEIIRMRQYFKTQKPTPYLLAALSVVLASDIFVSIALMILMYLYSVTHYGDLLFLQTQPWPFTACMIGTALSGAVVQNFLTMKLYRLTKSYILLAAMSVLTLGGAGGAVASAVIINLYTGISARNTLHTSLVIWLSVSASADVFIAAGLVFQLWKVKRSTRGFAHSQVSGVVERIIVQSIETGSVTSVLALVAMIMYLRFPFKNYGPAIAFILGRVYALNMLLVLLRGASSSANDGTPSDTVVRNTFGNNTKAGRSPFTGINVNTQVITMTDERIPMDDYRHGPTAVALPSNGLNVHYEEKIDRPDL